MASDDELRVILRAVADTAGADTLRRALRGVADDANAASRAGLRGKAAFTVDSAVTDSVNRLARAYQLAGDSAEAAARKANAQRGAITAQLGRNAEQDIARLTGVTGGLNEKIGLTRQEFLRGGAALIGFGVGLNVVANLADKAHDAVVSSIDAARDYGETVNKLDVVFGSASSSVKTFGANSATAMGLSQNAALAAAGTFGNLFTAMGLGQAQAATMSNRMVQLAADLASFHNISPEEALQKLQSGLVGEIEPMRALGVAINETQVQQRALRDGATLVNGQVSESAKVQARYALILEQTKTAQGDFARTSGSLANQERIAAAETAELGREIGALLLPAKAAQVAIGRDLVKAIKDFVEAGPVEKTVIITTNFVGADAGQFIKDTADAIQKAAFGQPTADLSKLPEDQRLQALRDVGVAFNEQGQAIDATSGKLLEMDQLVQKTMQAQRNLTTVVKAAANEQDRWNHIMDRGTDAGGFTPNFPPGPRIFETPTSPSLGQDAQRVLDSVQRRTQLIDITAEREGLTLRAQQRDVDAQAAPLRLQLADIDERITAAQRENVSLALQEAQAQLDLLPARRAMQDLERQITNAQDRRLQLTKEEAVLRAQQAANPASRALEDADFRVQELQAQNAAQRAAQRQGQSLGVNVQANRTEIRTILRTQRPQLALNALEAQRGVTVAQRDQQDAEAEARLRTIPLEQQKAAMEEVQRAGEDRLQQIQDERQAEELRARVAVAGLDVEKRKIQDLLDPLDKKQRYLNAAADALQRERDAFVDLLAPDRLTAMEQLVKYQQALADAQARGSNAVGTGAGTANQRDSDVRSKPANLPAPTVQTGPVLDPRDRGITPPSLNPPAIVNPANGGTSNPDRLNGATFQFMPNATVTVRSQADIDELQRRWRKDIEDAFNGQAFSGASARPTLGGTYG